MSLSESMWLIIFSVPGSTLVFFFLDIKGDGLEPESFRPSGLHCGTASQQSFRAVLFTAVLSAPGTNDDDRDYDYPSQNDNPFGTAAEPAMREAHWVVVDGVARWPCKPAAKTVVDEVSNRAVAEASPAVHE